MYIKVTGSGNTSQRRGWFVFHFFDEKDTRIPLTISDIVTHNFTNNITEAHFLNLFQQELSGVALTPSRETSTNIEEETYFIVKIPNVYKVSKIKFKTWSTDGSYFTNTKISFSRNNEEDSYKDIDNITASARNTIYESINFLNLINPTNKTLILHDGEYKKYEGIRVKNDVNVITTNTFTPISSGDYDSGRSKDKAFNGSIDTYTNSWGSKEADNQYLGVTFANPIVVNRIKISSPSNALSVDTSGGMPKSFIFQGSNDLTNWIDIATISNQTNWTNSETREYPFYNRDRYTSYRVFITELNRTHKVVYVSELEMYEDTLSSLGWSTIYSTLPTKDQFLSDGIDSLTPLLDRKVGKLQPLPMTDKSQILNIGEGKAFSETIDLKKYIDIRSIKVEVE